MINFYSIKTKKQAKRSAFFLRMQLKNKIMRNYVTLVFFGALLLIVGCKNEKEQIISEEEIVIEKTNP